MLKKLLLCALPILFLAEHADAQLTPAGRWAAEAFVDYGFIEPNITYATVDGIELKLDVYRAKIKASIPLPTVVFIHGGGWRRGSKEMYSLRMLPWLEKGWNFINVEYRLTPTAKAPAAVEDCRCALRWVVSNAKTYGVDVDRIVVSGQSAGGHLALMTGMANDEKAFDRNCPGERVKVAAIVNWFGITDVGDLLSGKNKMEFAQQWIGSDRLSDQDFVHLVSPMTYIQRDLPPIITIHGDADDTVPYPQAVRLHDALTKAGTANRLVTVKNGNHGDFSKKDSVRAYGEVMRFLDRNLKK